MKPYSHHFYTQKIITATQDLAVAFKPNLGFYERWGSEGFKWLEETMDSFEEDVLVIGDAKRGDIGNTATQYAKSLFEHFGFDAVTLSPYMGLDSIAPFISNPKKGVFIAIDGVAPAGKIKQQRSRRFKSVNDRRMYENIKKKHKKEIPNSWNNSAISPGTEFMEKLNDISITDLGEKYFLESIILISFRNKIDYFFNTHHILITFKTSFMF